MTNTTAITDVTSQLPQAGSDVGGFMDNIFPTVIALVLGFAIIGGIVGLFNAITGIITKAIGGKRK